MIGVMMGHHTLAGGFLVALALSVFVSWIAQIATADSDDNRPFDFDRAEKMPEVTASGHRPASLRLAERTTL